MNLHIHRKSEDKVKALTSFIFFFLLMFSYFILRPVRDEMGVRAGVGAMQWLFTGTFIAMLLLVPVLGWLIMKVKREILLPLIYAFFGSNLLVFYYHFVNDPSEVLGFIFFIWTSVFNLFTISLFWSFNSDIFSAEKARDYFGPIAAGGSLGAILGPIYAASMVMIVGIEGLLLTSSLLLFVLAGIMFLLKGDDNPPKQAAKTIWSGFRRFVSSPIMRRIGIYLFLYTFISTLFYYEQIRLFSESNLTPETRTSYFGIRDLLVNGLTLTIQFLLTGKIVKKFGARFGLFLVPMLACLGLFLLGLNESIMLFLGIQVAYRALNFSIQRPTRETLFTATSPEDRYQTKNFIDTVIYRGGDAVNGWLISSASSFLPIKILTWISIPIAVFWALTGRRIGKIFDNETSNDYEKIRAFDIKKKSA